MKFALFYHSLVSDWNHGNAHFLRGIATELLARGHQVRVFEPANGWSARNLRQQHGEAAIARFLAVYPRLTSELYDEATLDVERVIDWADVVIVHEWNPAALVARIGAAARESRRIALFHDTHHRAVTAPDEIAALDLSGYDGVLAFGETLRQIYASRSFAARAWTWHEAADTRVFRPLVAAREGDLVWIGNWGDGERAAELREFLLEPVRALRLRARVHGVRYPDEARDEMRAADIDYAGWLPNYLTPRVFAAFRCTVHVPRRPYAEALPGIPTIRMFEALACGIPLISAPWSDDEQLFPSGCYLSANSGEAMKSALSAVLTDGELAAQLSRTGLRAVLNRHTCRHRVGELLAIVDSLGRGGQAGGLNPQQERIAS
jgi:spore maturation protein CgeB